MSMKALLDEMMERLNAIEREQSRIVRGEITDTSPLSVTIRGSTAQYTDVAQLDTGVSLIVGDVVDVVVGNNKVLVLGKRV